MPTVTMLTVSRSGLSVDLVYSCGSLRCFTAKGKESIPIFGDFRLVRQIGTVEYARPRRFREKLNQWIRTIRLVWPECPAKISSDGLYLLVDHAAAVHPTVCLKSN